MRYTLPMPRPKKGKDKRGEPVTVLLPETIYQEIARLAEAMDRSQSYIGYRLIEKGLAAYRIDHTLAVVEEASAMKRVPVIEAVDEKKQRSKKRA